MPYTVVPELDMSYEGDSPDADITMLQNKYGVTITVVNPHGPGGGCPVVRLEGEHANVVHALRDAWDLDDYELWALYGVPTRGNAAHVGKTTTDKLESHLVSLVSEGWDPTPHFVGGRDWVVTCRRDESRRTITLK